VAHHLKPGQLYDERDRGRRGDPPPRAQVRADLLYRVAKADCLGRRPGAFEPVAMEWFLDRVRQLDVACVPRRRSSRGGPRRPRVPPGPEVGRVLRAVYERQLDGAVTTPRRRARRPGGSSRARLR